MTIVPYASYLASVAYTGSSGASGGLKWVILWPDFRKVFESWGEAHGFLLRELEWLASDFSCERTWDAWDIARKWQPSNLEFVYSVEACEPPVTFYLVKLGHEEEIHG